MKAYENNWPSYQIASINHPRFLHRRLGDLGPVERQMLKEHFMPAIAAQWPEASPAQKADYRAYALMEEFEIE